MLKVYSRTQNQFSIAKTGINTKKLCWIDCVSPTNDEIEQLSKTAKIPAGDFKDRLREYERPTTIEDENFSLIIFGAPLKKGNRSAIVSFPIFLCKKKNMVITLRKTEFPGITKFIESLAKSTTYLDSTSRITQSLIENIVTSFFEQFEEFQERADQLEARVFKAVDERAVEQIFKLRKEALVMHKALAANREVLISIEKQQLMQISKKDLHEFKDLRDDLLLLIDTEDTLRNILTGVLDIHTSTVSNQTNQIIKKLTVIASYVLIPTLIASIYGMNFKNMPEIPWHWGYPFSLGLMVASIIAVYIYFKKSKML